MLCFLDKVASWIDLRQMLCGNLISFNFCFSIIYDYVRTILYLQFFITFIATGFPLNVPLYTTPKNPARRLKDEILNVQLDTST